MNHCDHCRSTEFEECHSCHQRNEVYCINCIPGKKVDGKWTCFKCLQKMSIKDYIESQIQCGRCESKVFERCNKCHKYCIKCSHGKHHDGKWWCESCFANINNSGIPYEVYVHRRLPSPPPDVPPPIIRQNH